MIQGRLLNSPRSLVSKLDNIQGEYGKMGTGVYWDVFENTGLIEAYLTYSGTDEVASDSPVDSEELENKSLEGEE